MLSSATCALSILIYMLQMSGPSGKIEAAIKGLLPPGITIIGCTGRGVIGHSATKGPCEVEPSDEDEEDGSDEALNDLAVSLALAHVAGAKVHATMGNPSDFLVDEGEGGDTLYPATDFHGESNASGEYSVRAVCLADVKQRVNSAFIPFHFHFHFHSTSIPFHFRSIPFQRLQSPPRPIRKSSPCS